jgi:COP9 signalosome complex subunit 7
MSQLLFATFRLATSDNVLSLIEEKIDCASKMCQLNMDHQQELQGRIDEGKKNIHFKV